jgi:hypothetical protein
MAAEKLGVIIWVKKKNGQRDSRNRRRKARFARKLEIGNELEGASGHSTGCGGGLLRHALITHLLAARGELRRISVAVSSSCRCLQEGQDTDGSETANSLYIIALPHTFCKSL